MHSRKPTKLQHSVHNALEKVRHKVHRALPKQKHVEHGRLYKLFGSTILRPEFWSFKPESLARGLALGLFVALTPTIGFQMLLVGLLILFFPGNLPIALAACWITNPITAPPIFYIQYKIGLWLMKITGSLPYKPLDENPVVLSMYDMAGAMWLGSLIVALTAGLFGYWLMLGLVGLERRLRLSKILHLRSEKANDQTNNQTDIDER